MAKAKSRDEIEAILEKVKYEDRLFALLKKGDGYLLQLSYYERCVETGRVELQKSRKHFISPFMTESEIVETAFLCAQRSSEHVLREHFTYAGERIYSPHFHVNARLAMCREKMFDKREPPPGEIAETPPGSGPMTKPRWRVGTEVARAIYRNERCIGIVDSPEFAAEIVAAMNDASPNDREGIAEALMQEAEANRWVAMRAATEFRFHGASGALGDYVLVTYNDEEDEWEVAEYKPGRQLLRRTKFRAQADALAEARRLTKA